MEISKKINLLIFLCVFITVSWLIKAGFKHRVAAVLSWVDFSTTVA